MRLVCQRCADSGEEIEQGAKDRTEWGGGVSGLKGAFFLCVCVASKVKVGAHPKRGIPRHRGASSEARPAPR